ncbi:titin-like [Amphibalanus amphitrite]|uniref:titin-like n=1 Tax=Amphibalanus amphitrite TaxID=1232801 RepID=UPI001C8FFA4E|nr:titin-like [Amphibalanus amphitrite]
MRMLRFVIYGALALAVADHAAAFGAGPGATVLQEVQAPDLSGRNDGFTHNPGNTFVVSADLRPSASLLQPQEQRPVFNFPPQQQQQQQQQVVSRPPPPPPQAAPAVRPQPVPQPAPTFQPQNNQPPQRPALPASDKPVLDQSTVDVREINPPFLQQYNEDGTVYQPPPPPPPQPQQRPQPQQQRPRPQQPFRRPPPGFRRPPPPFGRLPPPPRPGGRPVRPRPSVFQNPLQQLQQRIFGRPPARAAPNRRRFRRDLTSDVDVADEIRSDVKQDRLGKWEMEYAMRKAADPASLKDNEDIPAWAPLKEEARALLEMASRSGSQGPSANGDLPITITEVTADSPEEARIPISAGDEVVIVRVPEESLNSAPLAIESSGLLRRSRQLQSEVTARQGRAAGSTGRADQPWWSRIPLLGSLIYRPLPGEETTPGYTPSGEATVAVVTDRAGYDTETVVSPLYDPYLSIDGSGRPYYRTPTHAELAHYEHIPDMAKPVLNPTEDFVVPDNIEDPFRGGYAPFRPGYQYVNAPHLPAPYYPPGDVKYHRRQQLFPKEINYHESTQKRSDDGTKVAARQAETTVQAAEAKSDAGSGLGKVLAQAAQDRAGELSIIDTGDHYAVISGDINKFVDFDGKAGGSTKARSLADLLKLAGSSDTSAPHSRVKRQASLYPLLSPVQRRPQRRPIQRRDDVGRFPHRAPTFRPPWESGRRVSVRPRGPRPLRPVSQRPNTRQPITSFQPPVPQPIFEQHDPRPVFHQSHERPVFEQHDERPFEQHNVQPTFEQPQESFEQFDARPSFEQPAARPEFEHHEARPTFHEPDSRPAIEQPGNDIITGPPAHFGGFQPVTRPAPDAESQPTDGPVIHEHIPHGQPRPVVSPVPHDVPRLTVVTTVPAPVHTEAVFVRPSRPVHQEVHQSTRVVEDQQSVHPQQQFAGSEQHQQVIVSSSFNSQPSVSENQVTEEDKPAGSWASAALAGLSAILGGSQETTTEPAPTVPTPDADSHSFKLTHQNQEEDSAIKNKHVEVPKVVGQNADDEEIHKDELKEKSTVKVVKRYRKRQRRPSPQPSASSVSSHRGTSHHNAPTVTYRRRRPSAIQAPASDDDAAETNEPAKPTGPKQRVTFGARVRPTAGQRRRRPIARRPTTSEPEPTPTPTTSTTQEPVTAEASQSVRRPVVRLPTRSERVQAAAPSPVREIPAPQPVPTSPTTQPTPRPTTSKPQTTAPPQEQEDTPSTGGFRPVAGVPRHRSVPPTRGRPLSHQTITTTVEPSNVENLPQNTNKDEPKTDTKTKGEKEEKVEDVHSQLESYLSRYAEKYGLGLVTSSPKTPRPAPTDKPAAPVSGLRWAHLAARSRNPAGDDVDELDEFVTGEPDGDERVSVGSQYSYRVQLPPSRRVPPALNSVRLRPKSKLAQLLGSSPRLRPSTAKPTIPWPAGYQPFTVSSTTPRPGRWAARRERLTTPSPTAAPAPTTGPAWSKYADEFTTTRRPTTEAPATSASRSRPIFIPPINRKRIRPRPLTLLHAGPRREETTTTTSTTAEEPIEKTEGPTDAPAVTIPAPPPVTQEISPEPATTENVETTTDSAFEDEDPLVASSEEPVGESSLFSVVYSKERPHVRPPQPEIFSRLNKFLVEHGEQPPTAPATVSVTVGASPIQVPVSAPVEAPENQSGFQASVEAVPVPVAVIDQEVLEEAEEEAEPEQQPLVTPDGAVIVRAVPAETDSNAGAWVPTIQAVEVSPEVVAVGPQPGTVVIYPEDMSQEEREQHWPQSAQEEKEEDDWFEEPDSVHDLDLSHDGLVEEVVYLEDAASGAVLGKAARLDDDAAPEAEFLVPVVTEAPVDEEDATEVEELVHDPYGVFWTSPSGATNAEQAESQQLAGAFAADVNDEADEADAVEVDSATDVPSESSADAETDDRTVNLCLDGKCMFIYEPGRQVRVSGDN